jgi:hypothetical protein
MRLSRNSCAEPINVLCPALAIPKGVDWRDVAQKVLKWFKEVRRTFAADGESWYTIPDVGFDLKVRVQTMDIPGTDGVVAVGRILPADRPFIDVLQKALLRKVPKLAGTRADKRILLLEDEGIATGFSEVIQGIESSEEELSNLKDVDEVWLVKTMVWKESGALYFLRLWPGGLTQRFRILDSRFSNQKPPNERGG